MIRSQLYENAIHVVKVELKAVNKEIDYLNKNREALVDESEPGEFVKRLHTLLRRRRTLKIQRDKFAKIARKAREGERYWKE